MTLEQQRACLLGVLERRARLLGALLDVIVRVHGAAREAARAEWVEAAEGIGLRVGLTLAQHRVHESIDEWMMARAREAPDADPHGDTVSLREAREQAKRVVAFECLSKGVPPGGDPK